MTMRSPVFLGLDLSTQSLKGIAIDTDFRVVYQHAVNFDADLPEFGTEGGAHHHSDGLSVTAPPQMWIAALDTLLERMRKDGFKFEDVAALSGSGQQHGSVYLKKGARRELESLRVGCSLRDQLANMFSIAESPIWMDSSASEQCRQLEAALGGPQAVANMTGSRAYERFTGNQIAKIYQNMREAYDATDRIALVSSFMASLLIGDYAPIDAADGSGMNLMNLRSKQWAREALDATAPELKAKLGMIAPSHSVVGTVHKRHCDEFGFSPDCIVIAFSGDNPNSLAGLMLRRAGEIAISLGTSDTVFGALSEPSPSSSEGHIFANPVDPDGFMALVCYRNGSLTREDIRDQYTGGSWKEFAKAMDQTPVGNDGRIAFFFKEPEITPPIMKTGRFYFDGEGRSVDGFLPEQAVRAVVEGQFLSMRLHGASIGLVPTTVLATGGASKDTSLIRVMCDVFGVPVLRGDLADSAALGAAYRALHGWQCKQAGRFVPFEDTMTSAPCFTEAAKPDMKAHRTYSAMMTRYAKLEKTLHT